MPATTIADPSGRFMVRGLSPGRYTLMGWAADGQSREQTEVEVRAGEVRRGVIHRLATTTTAMVRVRAGRAPVAGARVSLVGTASSEDTSFVSFTQADGTAVVHGVFPGTNTIAVEGRRVITPAQVEILRESTSAILVEVERAP